MGDRDTLFLQLAKDWGFVLDSDTCPVWASEFGCNAECPNDMRWFQQFIDFLVEKDVDWAYWPLNVGPKPGSGDGESYGMLDEKSWTPKAEPDSRLELLKATGLRFVGCPVVPPVGFGL